jgi:hypothetical protein
MDRWQPGGIAVRRPSRWSYLCPSSPFSPSWAPPVLTQSGWVCTRILAKAAAEMGPDLTRDGLKKVLEARPWDSGLGVTLFWPATSHNDNPYSFNREFIYKWVTASDGGWDLKRILPDPVFDCQGPNIPAGARTLC